MAVLRQIARIKRCTVNAALEEAIREFDLAFPVTFAEVSEP